MPKQSEIHKEKSKDSCTCCVALRKSPNVVTLQSDTCMTYYLPMDCNMKVSHPSSSQRKLSQTYLAVKQGIGGIDHRKRPNCGSTYLLGSGDEFCYKSCLSRVLNFVEKGYPNVVLVEYCLQIEKSSRLHLNPQWSKSPPRPILEELKNWSLERNFQAANMYHVA